MYLAVKLAIVLVCCGVGSFLLLQNDVWEESLRVAHVSRFLALNYTVLIFTVLSN